MASQPNPPPKLRHQRQSELRTVLRNQGQAGLEAILRDKGLSLGEANKTAAPAALIQIILDHEYPKPPPTPSEEKIAKAVVDCLARCRKSSAPLAMLEQYTAELRSSGEEWTDKEVSAVEDGVRKGLNSRLDRR